MSFTRSKLVNFLAPDSKELGSRVFGVPLGSLVRHQNKENFPVLHPNGALDVSADERRQPSPNGQSRSPDHKKMAATRRRTGADAINPNEGANFAKLKNYLLVEEEHFEALSSASLLSSSYGDLVTSSTSTGFRKVSNTIFAYFYIPPQQHNSTFSRKTRSELPFRMKNRITESL